MKQKLIHRRTKKSDRPPRWKLGNRDQGQSPLRGTAAHQDGIRPLEWQHQHVPQQEKKKKRQKIWPGKFPDEEKQMANKKKFFFNFTRKQNKNKGFPPLSDWQSFLLIFPSSCFFLFLTFFFNDDTHRGETRERALSHTAGSSVNWHSLSGGQFGRLDSKPTDKHVFWSSTSRNFSYGNN